MAHIVEPMGYHGHLKRRVVLLARSQTVCKVFSWVAHPAWNFNEGDDILGQVFVAQQSVHGLYVDIDTLVTELVTTACGNYQGVVVQVSTHQRVSHFEQTLSCSLAFLGELSTFRHKVVLETVGQNHIYGLVEQFLTLVGSYVADGCKTVNIFRSLLFNGMFALHIELTGHLVAVVSKEIVVERLVVASYAAANARGMSGEDRRNLRHFVLQVEQPETCHPLVGMIYHLLLLQAVELVEALNDQCCGV